MLQQRSILFILDNSGAKKARCIQVHKKPKRGVAFIADKMTASVQQLTSNNVKLKKGQLCQVLVLTTKKVENRFDGSSSGFDLNSGIVLDPNGHDFDYMERRSSDRQDVGVAHTLVEYPKEL